METTLEVLPVGGRGRRNRKWPDELKARIVADAGADRTAGATCAGGSCGIRVSDRWTS